MAEYLLSQINPPLRESFIRDGAVNAAWQAHGYEAGIEALEAAMEDDPGLEPAKLAARRQFLALAIKFLEASRDKQMTRALEHLKLWESFKKGELAEETLIPS